MANDIKHMYEVAEEICNNITFVYEDFSEWKPSFKKIYVKEMWQMTGLYNKG